jgi:hypothetical protein
VEPLEYRYEAHLLRVADGVLEQFALHIAGSIRTPLLWACASLEARKHDVVRVQIGTTTEADASFYSAPSFMNQSFTFEIPAMEEQRLRVFLDEAARLGGRRA